MNNGINAVGKAVGAEIQEKIRQFNKKLPNIINNMLAYNELKPEHLLFLKSQPYEVLEFAFLRMQQRKPVSKNKIKKFNYRKSERADISPKRYSEEAELDKMKSRFIYEAKGAYWFNEIGNQK